MFSDVPYELVPPGTPAGELRPLLRLLAPRKKGPLNPWSAGFSAGTQISSAIEMARNMIAQSGAKHGNVLLVSDLIDSPDDSAQLARTLHEMQRESIRVQAVALSALPNGLTIFGGLLGKKAVISPQKLSAGHDPIHNGGAPWPRTWSRSRGSCSSCSRRTSCSPAASACRRWSRRHEARRAARRSAALPGGGHLPAPARDRRPALEQCRPGKRRALPGERECAQGSGKSTRSCRETPAADLLGIDDDLALRKAVRSLELSRLGSRIHFKPQLILQRADAESRLETLASGGGSRAQRSRAAELLGVLQLASPANPQQRSAFLLKAVANLQKAIQLDPGNDEAKYNLEVALRGTHGVQTVQGAPTPNVTTGRPGSKGAAAGGPGGGY